MKTLIVEDDITSQLLLQETLRRYGLCDTVVNGKEAIVAVRLALDARTPYDLICLDIMMPEMDGQTALKEIRALEERTGIELGSGAKIIMFSALNDSKNVMTAFREACDGYVVKPIDRAKLLARLRELHLLE